MSSSSSRVVVIVIVTVILIIVILVVVYYGRQIRRLKEDNLQVSFKFQRKWNGYS